MVVVVIVAITAVVISTVRQPAEIPAASPEGVVQRYLQAVADDDLAAIRDTYTPAQRQRCASGPTMRPVFPDDSTSFEADMISTREVAPDTVEVRVRITETFSDALFGGDGYDHVEVFVVERTDEAWGIAQALWPPSVCSG